MKNLIGLNIGVTVACLLLSLTICGKVEDCKEEVANLQNAQAVEFEEEADFPNLVALENEDDPMEYRNAYTQGFVDGYDQGFDDSWFYTNEDIQVVASEEEGKVNIYTIDPSGEIQIYEKDIQTEFEW